MCDGIHMESIEESIDNVHRSGETIWKIYNTDTQMRVVEANKYKYG